MNVIYPTCSDPSIEPFSTLKLLDSSILPLSSPPKMLSQQELSIAPLLLLFSKSHGDLKEPHNFLKATCVCATSDKAISPFVPCSAPQSWHILIGASCSRWKFENQPPLQGWTNYFHIDFHPCALQTLDIPSALFILLVCVFLPLHWEMLLCFSAPP